MMTGIRQLRAGYKSDVDTFDEKSVSGSWGPSKTQLSIRLGLTAWLPLGAAIQSPVVEKGGSCRGDCESENCK